MKTKREIAMLKLMAAAGAIGDPWPTQKPKEKCRLPECNEITNHNKGYCCAEHFKAHRQQAEPRRS